MDRIIIELPHGHRYTIFNLDGDGQQTIQFVQRAPLHEPVEGILIQDLLRICIHRLQVLDHEKPWSGNKDTIQDLRVCLARQEARALIEGVKKQKIGHFELLETDPRDGHLKWEKL